MSTYKKANLWYVDWRDRQGKRHRRSYPTRGQAEKNDKDLKKWKRHEGPKPRGFTLRSILDAYKATRAHLSKGVQYLDGKWAAAVAATLRGQDPARIESQHLRPLREKLGTYSYASRKHRDNSIRRFLRFLHQAGHLKTEVNEIWPPVHYRAKMRTTTIPPETVARLKLMSNPLQLLIIMLGYHAGCRRAEIALAIVSDFDQQAKTLQIHSVKNSPIRTVPVGPELADYLSTLTAGRKSDEHLTAIATPKGRAVGTAYLNMAWLTLADEAGVSGLWIHDLRRTWATDLAEVASVSTLMKLGGWHKLASVAPYLHNSIADQRRSVNTLDTHRQNQLREILTPVSKEVQ